MFKNRTLSLILLITDSTSRVVASLWLSGCSINQGMLTHLTHPPSSQSAPSFRNPKHLRVSSSTFMSFVRSFHSAKYNRTPSISYIYVTVALTFPNTKGDLVVEVTEPQVDGVCFLVPWEHLHWHFLSSHAWNRISSTVSILCRWPGLSLLSSFSKIFEKVMKKARKIFGQPKIL